MAEIISLDTTWNLQINMNSDTVDTIDTLDEKGYKIIIGLNPISNERVVKEVFYDKEKYTYKDVENRYNKCIKCKNKDGSVI